MGLVDERTQTHTLITRVYFNIFQKNHIYMPRLCKILFTSLHHAKPLCTSTTRQSQITTHRIQNCAVATGYLSVGIGHSAQILWMCLMTLWLHLWNFDLFQWPWVISSCSACDKCLRHTGNLTKNVFLDIVRQMRKKSLAKEFKGTAKAAWRP